MIHLRIKQNIHTITGFAEELQVMQLQETTGTIKMCDANCTLSFES